MLTGKTVIITNVEHFVGTASSRACVEAGAEVWCHDRAFGDPKAREVFEARVPGVKTLDETDPAAAVHRVAESAGRLDALVSNDFYPAERAAVEDVQAGDFRKALEVLTVTPLLVAGAAAAHMKPAGQGRIVFVTSAAPLRGLPNYSMYATARGGANALAVSLAAELARDNITVNAVAPNYIESPSYFPPELTSNPDAMAKFKKKVPLGRLGQPGEVGATVAFLCSADAGFITGHVLPISGGWA